MSRVRVFIGSSSQGYNYATAIKNQLNAKSEVRTWKEGFFEKLGHSTLESLLDAAKSVDFAVLVLTPDDIVISRKKRSGAPRDNVIFELGLFMGRLGRERAFAVCSDALIPSLNFLADIKGITVATYKEKFRPKPATERACRLINQQIKDLGQFEVMQRKDLRRQAELIFGKEGDLKLVYSELTTDPRVNQAIKKSKQLSAKEKNNLATHALTPTQGFERPRRIEFRSTKVACVCEVRAAAYISTALKDLGLEATVLASSAPSVMEKLHEQSFVSVGAYSNKLTCQLLGRAKMIATIDVSNKKDPKFMCGRHRLTPRRSDKTMEDYGLIIGMQPSEHPSHRWVACAGLGEYGTSGAAYFLGNKWNKIVDKLRGKTGSFACIVKVTDESDDSAAKFKFRRPGGKWEDWE
jgi:hypothetical protein